MQNSIAPRADPTEIGTDSIGMRIDESYMRIDEACVRTGEIKVRIDATRAVQTRQ